MITDKRIVALRCEKEIRKDSEGEYTKEKTFVVGEAKLTPHPKGHRSRITRIGKQYDEDFKMGYFRVEYENEETEDLYVVPPFAVGYEKVEDKKKKDEEKDI